MTNNLKQEKQEKENITTSKDSGNVSPFERITVNANNLTFHKQGLVNLAVEVKSYILQNYKNGKLDEINNLTRFTSDFYPDSFDPRAADWIFVLNTMNFALWNSKGTKQWTVDKFTGYQALCVAIKRAIDLEIPIWNPTYYTKLTQDELENIFRSDDGETNIPLIHERLTILHQIGTVLIDKYKGSFLTCIKLCKNDSLKLADLIINQFESYRDEPTYRGCKVYLNNKIRALVTDIWYYFKKHEYAIKFDSTWMQSIFVDYRVSQIFLHFKAFCYNKEFLIKLEKNDELKYGSEEEIEIRSCSMFSTVELRKVMEKQYDKFFKDKNIGKNINYSNMVDNFLSDYRQVHDQLLMETQPLPIIKCVYY